MQKQIGCVSYRYFLCDNPFLMVRLCGVLSCPRVCVCLGSPKMSYKITLYDIRNSHFTVHLPRPIVSKIPHPEFRYNNEFLPVRD